MVEAEKISRAGEDTEDRGQTGRRKFLIIVAALTGIGLAAVLAWVLLMDGEQPEADAGNAGAASATQAIYSSLGEKFVVTFQQGARQRYLQTELTVMARNQQVIDDLALHAPLVRARVVEVLAAQDFDTLRTDAGKLALREELLASVQGILVQETGEPGVEQIYYTDFVLQ
jgi:flagellar FliL protein